MLGLFVISSDDKEVPGETKDFVEFIVCALGRPLHLEPDPNQS